MPVAADTGAPPNRLGQVMLRIGLGQKTGTSRQTSRFNATGGDDDRNAWMQPCEVFRQIYPRGAIGKVDVGEQKRDEFLGCQNGKRFTFGTGIQDLVAEVLHDVACNHSNQWLVLDQQDNPLVATHSVLLTARVACGFIPAISGIRLWKIASLVARQLSSVSQTYSWSGIRGTVFT